jgi:hypothetical protein
MLVTMRKLEPAFCEDDRECGCFATLVAYSINCGNGLYRRWILVIFRYAVYTRRLFVVVGTPYVISLYHWCAIDYT